MKKHTSIKIFITLAIILGFQFTRAISSDIAISEVLFDPSGIDTGLEYVVVKNFSNESINMTGWDLYPDGIGYFTFPDFSLGGGKSVKVLFHKNGTNNQENFYHASATGNMGNSSGSVAIFSNTSHNKNTIVSFVRYQKTGSLEHKTWEPAAASAGIWTAGTFVDISGMKEGQKILLKDFSQKIDSKAWSLSVPENIQKTPVKQNSNLQTPNQLKKSQAEKNQLVASQTNLSDSYAEATTSKMLGGYLWLVVGVVVGALVGSAVLILKRFIIKG